jgi:hypothetical protein
MQSIKFITRESVQFWVAVEIRFTPTLRIWLNYLENVTWVHANRRLQCGSHNVTLAHYFFSFGATSPNLSLGLPPWNSLFRFGLLDLRYSVGLFGRVISLYTKTEKRTYTHKHPCPEWDSNLQSQLPSERLPWPAADYYIPINTMESAISVCFCEEKLPKESASLAVAILLLFLGE